MSRKTESAYVDVATLASTKDGSVAATRGAAQTARTGATGFQLAAFRFAPPASVSGSANAKAHAASVSAKLTTNGSRRDAV